MISAYLNGNELSHYDSANRLISAGGNTYTYNAEDVRVRNLCGESETTYAYNTNGRLSQLLAKTTDGVITKYVYGIGLIGEETSGSFKTYHFDYRGSTAAITDINGNVTDTFEYDTYGNLVSRTGTSVVIFLYNGRDGVITDENGLIYMRARYYSPELRRFINADIIAGEISNTVTLNRYAYANGNPVSNIDPFGLSAERGNTSSDKKMSWKEFLQYMFKHQENTLLRDENWLSNSILGWIYGVSFNDIKADYENNSKNDIVGYGYNDYINDQNVKNSPVSKLTLCGTSMANNGCEVIAVYNALLAAGENPSMVDLVMLFEMKNIVILNSFIQGALGSNPYGIGKAFNALGMDYSIVSFNDLLDQGIYVFSFWTSFDVFATLHTVAMQNDGKGNYVIYNFHSDGEPTEKNPLELLDRKQFITGYRLGENSK